MDVVPYAFCDAVCAVVKDFGALVELTTINSNYGIWNAAAVATAAGRVTVEVDINYKDGVWLHRILKSVQNGISRVSMSFQDLKAINRRYVRTSVVGIGYSAVNSLISTLDEVKLILKYSAPFVNLAEMGIDTDVEIPEDILGELLSPFRSSSFSQIYVGSYSQAAEGFLKTQLQSEGLKRIDIETEGWSDELRMAIERFALAKPFKDVDVADSLVFDLKFLKKLLRKSCRHDWVTFTACFRVKFRKLRKFKKEMQIQNDENTIVWRRRDGVEVNIERFYDGCFQIHFSCYNNPGSENEQREEVREVLI